MRERRVIRGQSLTEFALLLPILTLIMVGTTDLARAFYTKVTLANAARVAAEYAVNNDARLKLQQMARTGANSFNSVYGLAEPCNSGEVGTLSCGQKRTTLVARELAVREAAYLGITLNDVVFNATNNDPNSAGFTSNNMTFVPNDKFTVAVRANFSPITPFVAELFGGASPRIVEVARLRHNCESPAASACTWP